MERTERGPVKSRRAVLLEIAVWWTVVLILLYGSSVLSGLGGVWADNAGTLPAAFCLIFPVIWAGRYHVNLDVVGLASGRWMRSLVTVVIVIAIVFPLYAIAYDFWRMWNTGTIGVPFSAMGRFPDLSVAWFANLVFVQLFAVALPEEVFYRGWMQSRLAAVFSGRVRVAGVSFGMHVVVAAGLFALSHLVVIPSPFRLAVFFPGLLFGYLRERTGSVVAPVAFHASCNIFLAVLQQMY